MKIKFLSLVAGLMLVIAAQAHAQHAVTTGNVNLRVGPGVGNERIMTLASGTQVQVLGCTTSVVWCHVSLGNITGWVSARYIRHVTAVSHHGYPYAPPPHGQVVISHPYPQARYVVTHAAPAVAPPVVIAPSHPAPAYVVRVPAQQVLHPRVVRAPRAVRVHHGGVVYHH